MIKNLSADPPSPQPDVIVGELFSRVDPSDETKDGSGGLSSCESEVEQFTKLDAIVKSTLGSFLVAGAALQEIRERELWKVGGHTSWAAYCVTVGGLTKVHANRLIRGAEISRLLSEVKPNGFTPASESQLRPLYRLKAPEQLGEVWERAITVAGGQPSAKVVADVVAEVVGEKSERASATSARKSELVSLIARIRVANIIGGQSNEIESLISELEGALKLS